MQPTKRQSRYRVTRQWKYYSARNAVLSIPLVPSSYSVGRGGAAPGGIVAVECPDWASVTVEPDWMIDIIGFTLGSFTSRDPSSFLEQTNGLRR